MSSHQYRVALSRTVMFSLPALLTLLALLTISLNSCIFFRAEKVVPKPDPSLLKAEIAMSDDYIRSKPGDLLAFVPKGWVVLDVDGKVSTDVVAVAVNPEYTLSMVVQSLRSNDNIRQAITREGLAGLARAAYDKRLRKTANTVRLLNAIDRLEYGQKRFGYYEFTQDSVGTPDSTLNRSRSVVLISSIDNLYEVSLVPTPITTSRIPDEADLKKIFHSIVVSLQF